MPTVAQSAPNNISHILHIQVDEAVTKGCVVRCAMSVA